MNPARPSYAGAEFEVTSCPLSPEMRVMYDRSTEFWRMLFGVFVASEVGREAGKGRAAMRWVGMMRNRRLIGPDKGSPQSL